MGLMNYQQTPWRGKSFNAVLISIEHIIFVKINSSGQFGHTEPLPLFGFDLSVCKGPLERYPASYFNAMRKYEESRFAGQNVTKK